MFRRRFRRGTAPLEFALVLPLLVLIMTVGWWVGQAGFTRVRTATEARQLAWEKRDQCPPGVVYDLTQDPLVSYREEEVQNVVQRRSPITGQNNIAKAISGLTDKTHDFVQNEFKPLKAPGGRVAGKPNPVARIAPHVDKIKEVGKFIPLVARFAPMLEGFDRMDPRCEAQLARYMVEGMVWAVRRTQALTTIGGNLPQMIAAAITLRALEARAIASWDFISAAKYHREAEVVEKGIPAAIWLLTRAVTN